MEATYLEGFWQILKDVQHVTWRCVSAINDCMAELSMWCTLYSTTKHVCDLLETIAYSEHGNFVRENEIPDSSLQLAFCQKRQCDTHRLTLIQMFAL